MKTMKDAVAETTVGGMPKDYHVVYLGGNKWVVWYPGWTNEHHPHWYSVGTVAEFHEEAAKQLVEEEENNIEHVFKVGQKYRLNGFCCGVPDGAVVDILGVSPVTGRGSFKWGDFTYEMNYRCVEEGDARLLTPHPHAEVIKQWADDPSLTVQIWMDRIGSEGEWIDIEGDWKPWTPHPTRTVRIKPEEPVEEQPQEDSVEALQQRVQALEEEVEALKNPKKGIDEDPLQEGDYMYIKDLNEEYYKIVCKAFEEAGFPRYKNQDWRQTTGTMILATQDWQGGYTLMTTFDSDVDCKRRRHIHEFL